MNRAPIASNAAILALLFLLSFAESVSIFGCFCRFELATLTESGLIVHRASVYMSLVFPVPLMLATTTPRLRCAI